MSTKHELLQVNYIALEFMTQKNGVRGELVGLGRSGHPTYCPVHALITRIRHLCATNAPLHSPLYTYYDTSWKSVDTTTLTTHLLTSTMTLGGRYGIAPTEISIRSLRSSGAMALLCA
jgi:hypothetical protein